MLAAFTPAVLSVPVTVATQGAALAVHCLVSRSLSAAGNPDGSTLYFRLAGLPTSSSHEVALRQVIRPGPALVGAGWGCAPAEAEARLATATATPNHLARD